MAYIQQTKHLQKNPKAVLFICVCVHLSALYFTLCYYMI